MPFLASSGNRLFYEVSGPSAAPAIVMLNSLGADLTMWNAQEDSLRERYRVVRYDVRGHGRSDLFPGPYRLDDLGEDLLRLLDEVKVDSAHLCGISLGGLTALWAAVRAPHRVRSLMLCNTAARIGSASSWQERIDLIRKDGLDVLAPQIVARWYTTPFQEQHPLEVEATEKMVKRTSNEGYVFCCAALREADLRKELARVALPTLVLCGTYDISTPPSDGRLLAQGISGATYVELPTSHLSNLEQPQEFARTIQRFIDQVTTQNTSALG